MMIWLMVGLVLLGMMVARAVPIWLDGTRRAMPPARRLRGSLAGIVAPARYWWGAHIEVMPPDEQADLLACETAALGQSRADSVRCPLCGAEVMHAWALNAGGQPTVAPGPVRCPQCDFRLDACRHCARFLPGSFSTTGFSLGGDEMTFGRCGFYRSPQPVERIAPPEMARRLKERGYEVLNSPTPIVDSFFPLDGCNAFQLSQLRLEKGGLRWPDARRAALLRLLLPRSSPQATTPAEPAGDEQWLV
jgi:hypothetical protein